MIPAPIKKLFFKLFRFTYTFVISLLFLILIPLAKNVYAIDIYTIEDLDSIRNDLSGSHVLMNDLDFNDPTSYSDSSPSNMAIYTTGEGWDPVGMAVPGFEFSGTFDGNGHEISNLFINNTTKEDVGLFGYIYEATISDVGVTNAIITSSTYAGILVSANDGGTIEGSYSSGSVAGYWFVGGLVGSNFDNSNVTNSYSDSTVVGNWVVGGLVGGNEGFINYSNSTGSVDSFYEDAGGIVGYNAPSGMITNSYSLSNVSGTNGLGGLIGTNNGSIENSYSQGSVTGTGSLVGGLIGESIASGYVLNTYSTGLVSTAGLGGGLIGSNAGFVGSSFWDTETSGITAPGAGTGKTTSEMKNVLTFTIVESGVLDNPWDIVEIEDYDIDNPDTWYIEGSVDYPRLFWEYEGYIFPEDPEDPEDPDDPTDTSDTRVVFHPDRRCHWKKPNHPTWIKLEPVTEDGVSGMLLTWTQYDANEIDIKIDDGTGNYPWKIEKTLNDGHEFLANVASWQNITLKPINHCKEGEYSLAVNYLAYPNGWYGQTVSGGVSKSDTLGYATRSSVLGTSTESDESVSEEAPMVPDTGRDDILFVSTSLSIIGFGFYFFLNEKSRKLALRGFEKKVSKGL